MFFVVLFATDSTTTITVQSIRCMTSRQAHRKMSRQQRCASHVGYASHGLNNAVNIIPPINCNRRGISRRMAMPIIHRCAKTTSVIHVVKCVNRRQVHKNQPEVSIVDAHSPCKDQNLHSPKQFVTRRLSAQHLNNIFLSSLCVFVLKGPRTIPAGQLGR